MNIKKAVHDFFIEDDPEYVYEPHTNVVHLNTPHARANAANAAALPEQDRRNTQIDTLRSDLHRHRTRLLAELARVDAALEALNRG